MRTDEVCSTTLEAVMDMIPPHLDIELIKIDIQGVDLEAAKSAGKVCCLRGD